MKIVKENIVRCWLIMQWLKNWHMKKEIWKEWHRSPNGRRHWCPWRNKSSIKFQFRWRICPTWYCWSVSCLEENVKFDNFLIRYISNVLTFSFYFRNKISIYNVFNMSFTNIWYSFSWIYGKHHFFGKYYGIVSFLYNKIWKAIENGFKCLYFQDFFTILSIKMSYFVHENVLF